jgi:hypothetical protein
MPRAKLPKVETVYRVWIEWDISAELHGDPYVCDVMRRIEKLKCPKSVDWTDNAGACWTAQIVITGRLRRTVEKFAEKVLRLMARYKNLEILSGIK